ALGKSVCGLLRELTERNFYNPPAPGGGVERRRGLTREREREPDFGPDRPGGLPRGVGWAASVVLVYPRTK
ncbi:MAG: hypothetical protein K2X32_13875, partial [Phycisphaerales bacterium]|nr:hypothetical protein [Phycisphaerales bacterium]